MMFAAGAVLALLSLALPQGATPVDELPWALNASLGVPTALILWRWGPRFDEALLHAGLALGAIVVALGMTFGNGGSETIAASFFFIWVSLYVFLFFGWRMAGAHLAVDTVLLVVALVVSGVDAPASVALLVSGTSLVVGLVTGMTRVELERLATTDQLTGLSNRRRLHETLIVETARSTRSGAPYSLVIMDLDGFKAVNDADGHHAGDQVLVRSTEGWQRCLRPTDLLVRYGGDEFIAVLPGCGAIDAASIAARLCGAAAGPCSVGAATWRPGDTADAVLRRADHHLYRSKQGGGSRATSDQSQSVGPDEAARPARLAPPSVAQPG